MKFFRNSICVLGLLLGMTVFCSPLLADPPSRVGRLNFMDGSVSFRSGSLDEWSAAALNYPMTTGDGLWTSQNSRAEVHIGSSAIRLAAGTDISFLNLDDQTVQIQLPGGSLDVRLRHLTQGNVFEIDTPNASVSLVVPGTYRVDVEDNGDARATVRVGQAEVTVGNQAFAVATGQSATVPQANPAGYWIQAAGPLDDWDAWCGARDQIEDTIASTKYVPADVVGVEDLDRYGTWTTTADYGPMWQPNDVASDWAPYSNGYWAWVEPWGWTWIDYSPWGFAPFHYGRWVHAGDHWGWIPGKAVPKMRPVYAPALVIFMGGDRWKPTPGAGGGVGWFPLGPREAYVPPYQVSKTYLHDLNIAAVPNYDDSVANRPRHTYLNRNVPGAVREIPSQSFGKAQSGPIKTFSPPARDIARAPIMGTTAEIVPQRESITARPMPPQGSVSRPPDRMTSRSVVARTAPPPAPLPFDARQKALAANKGRPLDQSTLRTISKAAPTQRTFTVRVANAKNIKQVKPPVANPKDVKTDKPPLLQQQPSH
ncbi:MAG: DUF6600 domain-containing protein [Rectinemataceae bacterium]